MARVRGGSICKESLVLAEPCSPGGHLLGVENVVEVGEEARVLFAVQQERSALEETNERIELWEREGILWCQEQTEVHLKLQLLQSALVAHPLKPFRGDRIGRL